uniref:Venom peptide Pp14a n=1 Tax=Pristhesancus plagipennis TaxID=1955184 RepID=A0A2K8JLX6_PRIPG|nr:venom peptide Pp14a [Pristhesancus plagipennis]
MKILLSLLVVLFVCLVRFGSAQINSEDVARISLVGLDSDYDDEERVLSSGVIASLGG